MRAIMSRQVASLRIRTHPSIERSIRFCTTPSFCKQPFVNGRVAGPKRIARDTTLSNDFRDNSKERCVINKICLYFWNLRQTTCIRWANSKSFLAKKLPLEFRPCKLPSDSAWTFAIVWVRIPSLALWKCGNGIRWSRLKKIVIKDANFKALHPINVAQILSPLHIGRMFFSKQPFTIVMGLLAALVQSFWTSVTFGCHRGRQPIQNR